MNREVVDRWLERGILGLVLAILIFAPLATGAVRTLEFLIVQGLTMGVMVLWLIRLWVSPKPQILWTPLCWIALILVVYAIIRYFMADIEIVARRELIHILVYAFLFFATINNLYRQASIRVIGAVMIGLATAISVYAIYQYLSGSIYVWTFIKPELYRTRASGTYICPNHLAGFLELLLPLALCYVLIARGRPLGRVFAGYAAAVMLAAIGASISRGGWISCAAGLVVLFCVLTIHRNSRFAGVILFGLVLAGGTVFFMKSQPLKRRYPTPPDSQLASLSDAVVRYDLWEAAIDMWRDHVLLGVGPGHYDYDFRLYRPQTMQARPEYAHNEYLNALAEWGVVGMGLILSAVGALAWGVVRTWKHLCQSGNELSAGLGDRCGFVLGASCGLLALALHSVVDFNLQIPANAILATCLAALLNSHLRFASGRYWRNVGRMTKGALTISLLCGTAFLGWQEIRRGRQYVELDRAEGLRVFSLEQAAALQKAFVAEPRDFEVSYQLGEAYRLQSFEGGDDYESLARKAMEWYAVTWKLNPLDGASYSRYGMCLDWIDQHEEAMAYFNKADELEPNSCFMAANIGWHYVQVRNYAAARIWFWRSKMLLSTGNDIANSYFEVSEQKLRDGASTNNTLRLP